MHIEEIAQRFLDSPPYLDNGAGFLALKWGCTREEVYEAKRLAREILKSKHQDKPKTDHGIMSIGYIGSEQSDDGTIKKFESPNPLTPKEIEELAGVDNINTYVARVWDKLLPSGKWVYSIDIRYRAKDFYTKDQLQERLKELMPDVQPLYIPVIDRDEVGHEALVICLADDHVGAVNVTNIFDNKDYDYESRLMIVLEEVLSMGRVFDEVHIVSLGDQMNGWSSQTTRGGHEVRSLSNTEQFDIYVKARVKFYDNLFTSGISDNFFVHDVENSNHSGLGMSYMANQAIALYLEARYPTVTQESVKEMIGGFQYGQHVVIFGHGKDEKFQKKPMPATLNANTDLYLYDYIQNKGYSPYKENISFYKGDLHQLGFQMGKFGRYVNVQSLAGNSDYGDLNFGNTKGGALLEILHKESYRITSQPIWF